jgi:hypothetical protein
VSYVLRYTYKQEIKYKIIIRKYLDSHKYLKKNTSKFFLKFEIAQECAFHEGEETRTPNSVPFKYLHSVYLQLELRYV